LRSGRARLADPFRPSSAGAVEELTSGPGGELSESIRLCGSLGDDEVPAGWPPVSPA
jgi:hypothetical protein